MQTNPFGHNELEIDKLLKHVNSSPFHAALKSAALKSLEIMLD